jgi:hypothetical protein
LNDDNNIINNNNNNGNNGDDRNSSNDGSVFLDRYFLKVFILFDAGNGNKDGFQASPDPAFRLRRKPRYPDPSGSVGGEGQRRRIGGLRI